MADSNDTSPGWMSKVGMVLTVLPCLAFIPSAYLKLTLGAQVVAQLGGPGGMSNGTIQTIGVIELTCLALYLIPRTAVLGAALLTGYLGGATFVHVHQGHMQLVPFIIGVVVWGGIWGREPRVRALMPLRT